MFQLSCAHSQKQQLEESGRGRHAAIQKEGPLWRECTSESKHNGGENMDCESILDWMEMNTPV